MLAGKHILVVEDEPIIALDLEAAVQDQQGIVIGPIGELTEAVRMAQTAQLDGAILDLRLRQQMARPVADALLARNIPFVYHSGQAHMTGPDDWPSAPAIIKPAAAEHVIKVLAAHMAKQPT